MKSKLFYLSLVTLVMASSASVSNLQAQIIYEDTFSRGTTGTPLALGGTTPDTVDTTAATWISASATTNGTVALAGSSQSFLAFAPTAGNIYTLSADLTATSGDWVALGFSDSANSGTAWHTAGNSVGPWMLMNSGATPGIQGFGGPDTSNGNGSLGAGTQGGLYTITLNTTAAAWTYSFAGPGITTVTPFTFDTNPTGITDVGFGSANGASVAVANFTLAENVAAAPEPSTYLLVGLGGLTLLIVRQRRIRLLE